MTFKRFLGTVAALATVTLVPIASGAPFANSLWIGNDTNAALDVLNTDRSGNVLRTIPGISAVGFGVDLATNTLFVNQDFSSATKRDLTTLAPTGSVPTPVSEDLSFGGGSLWAGDFSGMTINRLDPTTGAILNSFSVGYSPLGLAYGNGQLWVSEFSSAAQVHHYDLSGALLDSFTAAQGGFVGGIGYDTTDDTLWIGGFGNVYHYTTAGTPLGSFSTGDGRFVDGLEFEGGSVPEPSTGFLIASGLLFAARLRRKGPARSV